jgi:hypothetical protein
VVEGGVVPVGVVLVVVVATMEEGMGIQGGAAATFTQTSSHELLVKKMVDLLSACAVR